MFKPKMHNAPAPNMKSAGGPVASMMKESSGMDKKKKFNHALMKHKKPEHSGMKKLFNEMK